MKAISYECRHILPSGAKCEAIALKGKPFCYCHTRLHIFKARPKIQPMDDFYLPFLEDRHSILLALSMIADALCSCRIDSKRAGQLQYNIQLALQTIDRTSDVIPITTVETITLTGTGEELGPRTHICDSDNCVACPERDTCENSEYDEEEEEEEEVEEVAVDEKQQAEEKEQTKQPQPTPHTVPTIHASVSKANSGRKTARCSQCAVHCSSPHTVHWALTTDNLKLTTDN